VAPPLPPPRASDAEREAAVEVLREAAGDGRLTVEELADRVEAADHAVTRSQLAALTADLPATRRPLPARSGADGPRQRAVLSVLERRGRWRLEPGARYLALLGSVRLDLRDAVLPGRDVVLEVRAVLGSVEVIVPEGVEVEVTGGDMLGGRDVRLHGAAPPPGAPVVRVHATNVLGSVHVWTRRKVLDVVADAVRRRLLGRLDPP
jgi:uncharacterized protein DUF1707/cell wall-active antibiotic response 4TMS protein YvqF